jgi:major membrane immunogen (membrane-anchored lipoprotein)
LAYWSDVLAGRQSALKDAVAGATSTSQTFEQQTKDTRDALDAAKNATDNFKLSLDILSGANVSSIELESRFQAALAEADGAMKNLSGSRAERDGRPRTSSRRRVARLPTCCWTSATAATT